MSCQEDQPGALHVPKKQDLWKLKQSTNADHLQWARFLFFAGRNYKLGIDILKLAQVNTTDWSNKCFISALEYVVFFQSSSAVLHVQ